MAGAPRGAVASPDAASLTRGGAARKRRRKVDASGHSLGATEGDGARAKRETSDGDVVPVPPVGRGYPTLCRGAGLISGLDPTKGAAAPEAVAATWKVWASEKAGWLSAPMLRCIPGSEARAAMASMPASFGESW